MRGGDAGLSRTLTIIFSASYGVSSRFFRRGLRISSTTLPSSSLVHNCAWFTHRVDSLKLVFALAEWNGDLRPHPYASIWNVAGTHGHRDCVGSDGGTSHDWNRSRAGCFPADVASPWHPHPCARDNLWIPRRHCCIDGFALVFCLHVGF